MDRVTASASKGRYHPVAPNIQTAQEATMFVIIIINDNITSFEIKDCNVAMEAVRRRVDALSRSKLNASVEVYAAREHICPGCAVTGYEAYGSSCECRSLIDQWLAEWSSDNGWSTLDRLHEFVNAWNDLRNA